MAKDCFEVAGISKEEQLALFHGMDVDDVRIPGVIDDLVGSIENKKLNVKRQAVANNALSKYVMNHPKGPKAGLTSLLVKDLRNEGNNVSLEKYQEAITGEFQSKIVDLMDNYMPTKFGFAQDKTGMRNMIREMFGAATGDPDAAHGSKIWKDASEELRARYNKAGGEIQKLEDWNLPQSHDPILVGKRSQEEWMSDIKPLLNREKMKDANGNLFTDQQLDDALSETYKTIASDGTIRIDPGKIPPGISSKMASRHQEHRFLHFKDGDSWLKYQEKYGGKDLYGAMMDHVDIMSKEIAAMEMFGPDPDGAFGMLKDLTVRETGNKKSGDFAQDVYDNVMGRTFQTGGALGDYSSTLRNLQVSAKLTSAMLSAISDTAFLGLTSRYNGIPMMKVYGRFIKSLNPTNKADRKLAAKLQLGAEYALDRAVGANRFTESRGYNSASKLSDMTMRLSGLQAWTLAGKQAFGIEYLANLGGVAGKSFDDVPDRVRAGFKRYGITSEDWEAIRKAPLLEDRGVKIVDPAAITDQKLNNKLVGMVLSERESAVPEPDARVSAILNQGTKAGTIEGEAFRFVTMFKSFPVTMITTHAYRALAGEAGEGGMSRMSYTANLLAWTTILGGVAYQAKEISKGREPRSMDEPEFWAQAMLQGGGLGIFGDFLLSDQNRYGGSLAQTLGGPVVQMTDDVLLKLFIGNGQEFVSALVKGTPAETEFKKDFVKALKNNVPVLNLWYTRVALERVLWDQLEKLSDPEWEKKTRTMTRKTQRETGQDYWWSKGELSPGAN